ncbi:MAG: hypothetical protein ACFFCM_14180 [Promethearchaeota archaeon]
MDLTHREKSQIIFNSICIVFLIILISFDIIVDFINRQSLLYPISPRESWEFYRYFLILLIIWDLIMIVYIVKPRKLTPEVEEITEILDENIHQKIKDLGINLEGEILKIVDKVGYSDPAYARKRIRKWPWREKGKIVLTDKELIFLGEEINIIIPLSKINVIQPFIARGGIRTFKVCEISYSEQNRQAIFMGVIGFSAFDPPSELELKSMRLLDYLKKWYEKNLG